MRAFLALQIFGLCVVPAWAQSSPSFRLEEWVVNAGGHPRGGIGLASASYRVSLDAVGKTPTVPRLQGPGYSMDVGFVGSYPPPREVREVRVLGDKTTFSWIPDRSSGVYRVYRGDLEELPGDYGACRIAEIAPEYVSLEEIPAAGQPFFYLVTAQNMLLEEGTIGHDSAGGSRVVSAPCP